MSRLPAVSRRCLAITVLAMLLSCPRAANAVPPVPAAPESGSLRWTWGNHDSFDECYRDRYVDTLSDPAVVKLVHQVLIADEMGKEYNDYQPVRGKTQAKKVLMLDDADVTSALLMVGGTTGGCDVLINGKLLGAKPLERTYWNAEFDRYVVPPALLRKGANEIVFRAQAGKEGSIRIENCEQPRRSGVSHDAGASWDFDHLAVGGYCTGEFEVRLNIGRFAPSACLRSTVFDTMALPFLGAPGAPQVPPVPGLPGPAGRTISRIDVDADTPSGTSVDVAVRTGATPDGYEENWSRWYAWPTEKAQVPPGRFAQWRLLLSTTNAQKTPVVRSVRVVADSMEAPGKAAAPLWAPEALHLDDSGNQHIVRSSYDFAYGDYDGTLSVLRKNWDLAGAVYPGTSEVQKLQLLRQWVREQWKNGWDIGPLQYVPSWDARVILTMAPRKLSLGMCTHYATTFVQCSESLGYTSRSIFWGHALSESWSDDLKKWVVMDAGLDPNDRRRATYDFERGGTLLNQLEVHKAYYIDKKWQDIHVAANNMSEGSDKVEKAFPDDGVESLLKESQGLFMPLRNNFIDHREPEEPEHGMGYFKFLHFIFWKDAATPDVPWTDFFTTRTADLYWTLDQAEIHLKAPAKGGKPALEVMLDTVTPNFAGYEYRIDGKAWVTWQAPTPLPATGPVAPGAGGIMVFPMKPTGGAVAFPWALHAGKNTLEARPFNKAGHRGIVSTVGVTKEG